MLSWVGKRPLTHVTAFPAQHVETFDPEHTFRASATPPSLKGTGDAYKDWPAGYPKGGLLFHGDNKEVLAHLLANGFRGKVDLVYIDPPFDSGADYVRKVELRGAKGTTKIDGESYTLGEQIQYTDIWANDNYLQFMYERFLLLKELLSEKGSIFVHCDDSKNYLLRIILDEVFSPEGFRNEIIWKRSTSTGLSMKRCGTLHDTIFWYTKGLDYKFLMQYHDHDEEYLKRAKKDENGRLYIPIPTGNPGPRPNLYYEYKGYLPHPNGYKWKKEKMEMFDKQGRLLFPESKDGRIQYKQFLDEMDGVKLQDLWLDVYSVNPVAIERIGFPTQKPTALLQRIISMTTDPFDLILDCFIGSGTTIEATQKLGRRWIGCDINKGAIQTTAKRLQGIITEQIEALKQQAEEDSQGKLIETDEPEEEPKPAQLGFSVWRVNDYDLAIQHNEAVNLACEHIGIVRTRANAYFDGTLGKKLVKIVPFSHPLTPLDLEELKRELDARPEEDRNITMVCLGMEIAAAAWVEDWNRLRKGSGAVNKVNVIELRTDPKYGGFISHEPAKARVKIARKKEMIGVEILDFASPSIIERLRLLSGVSSPKINDWHSMVDCVMIDTAYDGNVFNVVLSDIPVKKTDLVSGKYELAVPKGETTVAVKIVDMLGEEVLVTEKV
ncbi:MAG: site-specific DNA-methyltransferase [Spirochaetes bacterium]|nr:MAG: site-specific DNA-methyltransferase [Spirochaetota bacterium]